MGTVGGILLKLLLVIKMAVSTFTRDDNDHKAIAKAILSRKSGSPIVRTAMRLLSMGSDSVMIKGIAGLSKRFSLSIHPKGCLLGISCVKCAPFFGRITLAHGGPHLGINGIRLTSSTVVLTRTMIITRTPRIATITSALICGDSTCHIPRNSTLRRLIGGLPKTRISRSKGVAVGKGRVGGVVVSKGRFFTSSPGVTVGGLPMGVVSGIHTCSGRSSLTHIANVSSNRRRAILSLDIGPNVGGK